MESPSEPSCIYAVAPTWISRTSRLRTMRNERFADALRSAASQPRGFSPVSDDAVLLAVDDGVATITLNRPKAGNTINMQLTHALRDIAERCAGDSAIRCVVMTGAGKLFCGGGDISGFSEATDISSYLDELAGALHMRMPKPLVTLINGPAAGAGLSLAISGDIVIAARSATFLAAYGGVGLTPDGGMSWLLPRLVGMRRAQEMIIGNRMVDAGAAEAMGLVTQVVDDADLTEAGARQARKLATMATGSIAGSRLLLLSSYEGTLEEQLAREVRSISAAAMSAECREGVSAFVERRKPDFTSL